MSSFACGWIRKLLVFSAHIETTNSITRHRHLQLYGLSHENSICSCHEAVVAATIYRMLKGHVKIKMIKAQNRMVHEVQMDMDHGWPWSAIITYNWIVLPWSMTIFCGFWRATRLHFMPQGYGHRMVTWWFGRNESWIPMSHPIIIDVYHLYHHCYILHWSYDNIIHYTRHCMYVYIYIYVYLYTRYYVLNMKRLFSSHFWPLGLAWFKVFSVVGSPLTSFCPLPLWYKVRKLFFQADMPRTNMKVEWVSLIWFDDVF